MPIRRLIYFSRAASSMNEGEIKSLLKDCRPINQRAGITGILLHIDGVFAQVLEGDAAVIADTMERIEGDPRHSEITVLSDGQVPNRAFDDWSMAFLETDVAGLMQSAGLEDVEAAFAAFAGGEQPEPSDPVIVAALTSLSQQVNAGTLR